MPASDQTNPLDPQVMAASMAAAPTKTKKKSRSKWSKVSLYLAGAVVLFFLSALLTYAALNAAFGSVSHG